MFELIDFFTTPTAYKRAWQRPIGYSVRVFLFFVISTGLLSATLHTLPITQAVVAQTREQLFELATTDQVVTVEWDGTNLQLQPAILRVQAVGAWQKLFDIPYALIIDTTVAGQENTSPNQALLFINQTHLQLSGGTQTPQPLADAIISSSFSGSMQELALGALEYLEDMGVAIALSSMLVSILLAVLARSIFAFFEGLLVYGLFLINSIQVSFTQALALSLLVSGPLSVIALVVRLLYGSVPDYFMSLGFWLMVMYIFMYLRTRGAIIGGHARKKR